MVTAKIFKNGRSQAVRLPKQFAFSGTEVYVKKINGIVMLLPKGKSIWGPFIQSLDMFSDDFMRSPRGQGSLENRDSIE